MGLFAFPLTGGSTPPPPGQPSISAAQIKSVSIAAAGGNDVTISLPAVRGTVPLPKSFVVVVNGQHVLVNDLAGNGQYVGTARFSTPVKLTEPFTVPLEGGKTPRKQNGPKPTVAVPGGDKTHCSIQTVECPPDCKSDVFKAPCILCLKIDCKIVIM